jgi:hypothetical protein
MSVAPSSAKDMIVKSKKSLLSNSIYTFSILLSPWLRASAMADSEEFIDLAKAFRVKIYPGWRVSKGPTQGEKAVFSINPKSIVYKAQQILLSASNFAEGASFIVLETDARRLLKEGNIDWWFAPIDRVQDLGSPSLIANLLIKERIDQLKDSSPYQLGSSERDKPVFNDYQNAVLQEFDLIDASFDSSSQSLLFTYKSPIALLVDSLSFGKSYYRNGKVITIIISALNSVADGDYGAVMKDIRQSFSLLATSSDAIENNK